MARCEYGHEVEQGLRYCAWCGGEVRRTQAPPPGAHGAQDPVPVTTIEVTAVPHQVADERAADHDADVAGGRAPAPADMRRLLLGIGVGAIAVALVAIGRARRRHGSHHAGI